MSIIARSYREQLAALRATSLRQSQIAGHTWSFYGTGSGGTPLVVLPGGLAEADAAFRYHTLFGDNRQVLTLAYPPTIDSLGALLTGLAAWLEAQELPLIDLVGGSFSGLVAQAFARRHPERIRRLVLSDTGVPVAWRGLALSLGRRLVRLGGDRVFRGLARRSMAPFLASLASEEAFWREYFAARLERITASEAAALLGIWCDFDRSVLAPHTDTAPATLLIVAADDQLFDHRQQRVLLRLYPKAQVKLVAGSHNASLEQVERYLAAIGGFLA